MLAASGWSAPPAAAARLRMHRMRYTLRGTGTRTVRCAAEADAQAAVVGVHCTVLHVDLLQLYR